MEKLSETEKKSLLNRLELCKCKLVRLNVSGPILKEVDWMKDQVYKSINSANNIENDINEIKRLYFPTTSFENI